jgi:hypothetical protein
MMKSHSVYKTNNQARQALPEYIKGTQVTKDFQLVAEPILPKLTGNQIHSQSLMNSSNGYGAHPSSA